MLKVRVVNLHTGREDIHEGLTKEDLEWISVNPNLQVEVLEVYVRSNRKRFDK